MRKKDFYLKELTPSKLDDLIRFKKSTLVAYSQRHCYHCAARVAREMPLGAYGNEYSKKEKTYLIYSSALQEIQGSLTIIDVNPILLSLHQGCADIHFKLFYKKYKHWRRLTDKELFYLQINV